MVCWLERAATSHVLTSASALALLWGVILCKAWCKEGAFGVEEVAFPLGQKLDWFEFGFKKVEGTSPVPTPEKVLQLKEEAIKGFGCFGGFPPRFHF